MQPIRIGLPVQRHCRISMQCLAFRDLGAGPSRAVAPIHPPFTSLSGHWRNRRSNSAPIPCQATPPTTSGGGGEDNKSQRNAIPGSDDEDDPTMLALSETTSTSGRLSDDDTSSGDKKSNNNLLQRFMYSFAALVPLKIRRLFVALFTTRLGRLIIFLAVGMTISILGHLRVGGAGSPVVRGPLEVAYSDFLHLIKTNNVKTVRFEEGTGRVLFDLAQESSGASSKTTPDDAVATVISRSRNPVPRQFYTRKIADPQLIPTLLACGVQFGAVRASATSAVLRVVATALMLWIPLIPLFVFMKRSLDGKNGTSRKKRRDGKTSMPPTTFADVAGVGPAKEELQEVVACLRDSRRFARLGAKLPSGVLLCGPPGTGKTLLARAVAGEAGVPFLSVSASEFVEMFVGRGAARVRELFAEARKRAPCVVFIDELDAVGSKRGGGYNEERDQTLNQLLTELDGFEQRPGVLLLAATNRPEILDPALMRPGRLSRKVNVPLPDESSRAAILQVHLRGCPLANDMTIESTAELLARITSGFSGAELMNVVNEAAFLAARRDGDDINVGDLVDAVSRTRYGVNGGGAATSGLMRRLQDWLVTGIESNGGKKSVQMRPMGGG